MSLDNKAPHFKDICKYIYFRSGLCKGRHCVKWIGVFLALLTFDEKGVFLMSKNTMRSKSTSETKGTEGTLREFLKHNAWIATWLSFLLAVFGIVYGLVSKCPREIYPRTVLKIYTERKIESTKYSYASRDSNSVARIPGYTVSEDIPLNTEASEFIASALEDLIALEERYPEVRRSVEEMNHAIQDAIVKGQF